MKTSLCFIPGTNVVECAHCWRRAEFGKWKAVWSEDALQSSVTWLTFCFMACSHYQMQIAGKVHCPLSGLPFLWPLVICTARLVWGIADCNSGCIVYTCVCLPYLILCPIYHHTLGKWSCFRCSGQVMLAFILGAVHMGLLAYVYKKKYRDGAATHP